STNVGFAALNLACRMSPAGRERRVTTFECSRSVVSLCESTFVARTIADIGFSTRVRRVSVCRLNLSSVPRITMGSSGSNASVLTEDATVCDQSGVVGRPANLNVGNRPAV
ncbi:hypothetical protein, partial [Piscinibacter sp.]|uniref:hypothetical protein n=1 Tax=Piscinibacter sp. TaxID=1903157 RepID=UPI0035595770